MNQQTKDAVAIGAIILWSGWILAAIIVGSLK